WKDSGNAITNQDGSPVVPPVALVEVQGAVYRAKPDAAWLHPLAGDAARARELERAAQTLRTRFQRAYWLPRRRFLAVALQQGGRPAASLASNQGQALWSGIVDPKHADAVAKRLLSTPMFSGWGIRTLAVGEAAFNPIDYQVGAVWPHDNSLIAAGPASRRSGHRPAFPAQGNDDARQDLAPAGHAPGSRRVTTTTSVRGDAHEKAPCLSQPGGFDLRQFATRTKRAARGSSRPQS